CGRTRWTCSSRSHDAPRTPHRPTPRWAGADHHATAREDVRTMTDAAPEGGQRRLRAGVIGLGCAGQQHVAAYAADPAVDLVALSAMEEHLLTQFGDAHVVPGRYQDRSEERRVGKGKQEGRRKP